MSSPVRPSQSSPIRPPQSQWAQAHVFGNGNGHSSYYNGSHETSFSNSHGSPQQTDQHADRRIMFLEVLMKASESDLLQSQNPVFTSLKLQVTNLEAVNAANRELIDHLKSIQNAQPSAIPTQIASNGNLIIPSVGPPPQRADFPKAKFWTKPDWQSHQADCARRNRQVHKLGFITDAEGEPIDKPRLQLMSHALTRLFNSLHKADSAPSKWGGRTAPVNDYVNRSLQEQFPEFGLCDGEWKAIAFCTIKYPNFNPASDNKETMVASIKRKSEDEEKPINIRPGKKSKKQHGTHGPPSNAKVIDLSEDEPTSSSDQRSSSSSDTSGGPQMSPEIKPASQRSSADTTKEMQADVQISTTVTSLMLTTEIPEESAIRQEEVPVRTKLKDYNTLPPSDVNQNAQKESLFANLSIPAPSTEVLLGATPPDPASSSETATSKKGKPMRPSDKITARNLFAIDYLKDHPETSPQQFKLIWDGIDKDKQKEYEDLAKIKKNAVPAPDDPKKKAARGRKKTD